jgi:chemotaxis protein MotA
MFVIIGVVVVFGGVFVGFMMAGGNPVVLIQISEFVTIGGAAIGSILIASPLSLIKKIVGELLIYLNRLNIKNRIFWIY